MISSSIALHLMGTLPPDLLIVYAWTRLLRMRAPLLFSSLLFCLITVAVVMRGEAGSAFRFACLILGFFVLPFLFSTDGLVRKAFVIALVNVIIIVAEFAGLSIWFLLTGLDFMDENIAQSHLGEYTLMHSVHLLVLAALFWAFHRALKRFDHVAENNLKGFVWFPLMQALLLGLPLAAGVYFHQGADVLYYGVAVLSFVCCAADLALFASIDRLMRKRREDGRAALLQQQLDACLRQSVAFVREAKKTAQLRHDVRNQAHVIMVLAERGELSHARDHLSGLREQVRGSSKRNGEWGDRHGAS